MADGDETLFGRVQQGDTQAFAQLVARYQARVYSIALRTLHHVHDAQDAAQQAFLQVWHKRHTYNPRWPFRLWLYRVVTNVCIDAYRRQQRERKALAASWPWDARAEGAADEQRHLLARALAALPVEARLVLVLCYLDGLSYAEVARVRGISVNTVKSQLRRAKALLRRYLVDAEETV